MKCENSAFNAQGENSALNAQGENSALNAQGSRLIVVVLLHVGAVKIYVGSSSGGAQEKGKRE
jgi:hypothetical protein